MSIKLHISNNLEELAKCLSVNLKRQSAALQKEFGAAAQTDGGVGLHPVFQPQYIVSQTIGMNIWLKTALAGDQHLGVAANIRFLKPNDLIHEIYYALDGKQKEALSADQLQWILFSELNNEQFTGIFSDIAAYYKGDDVKRMALAQQLADLFDQYQIYRSSSLIEKWNRGEVDQKDAGYWQYSLWKQLKRRLGDRMPDKTEVRSYILEALKEAKNQVSLEFRFRELHIFGSSILTPFHVELFYKLARTMEVHFYFLNPAPYHYWLEDKSEKELARYSSRQFHNCNEGNSLMTGWGKVVRDTFSLFLTEDVLFNNVDELNSASPEGDLLLKKIQRDIFENAVGENRNRITRENLRDDSLTINSCYTPAREVEVLKDHLLHLIDKAARTREGTCLSPRDMVVMVPDIDSYAPYIRSVFEEGSYKIPYTIADEAYASNNSLMLALKAIFSINEERFSAEEVMQLLDFELVRQRFSITDVAFLREVVASANIRFGMKGNEADDSVYVSWENGFNRMLFGLCMKGVDKYTVEGDYSIHPLDAAEGSASVEIVRLCQFVQTLQRYLLDRNKERSVREWAGYLEALVDDLICQEEEASGDDYRRIFYFTGQLNGTEEVGEEVVAFGVFRQYFISVLQSEKRYSNYQHGGITFCSMIPMRSVPFKVVAMLGLNYDQFPRKEKKLNFSLIDGKQLGDRNVKENDKHLFLETLLSAGEHLYISYIGQSSKDNSVIPPSILVDELLDYIESGMEKNEKAALVEKGKSVRGEMVTNHPLHGFSKKYYSGNGRLYTFSNYYQEVKKSALQSGEVTPVMKKETISIEAFIGFFKNPFKAFYNKVLNIYYGEDEVLLPESELFGLDKLQEWQVKNDLLLVDDGDLDVYVRKAVKTGKLPLKNMGVLSLSGLNKEVDATRKLFRNCIGDGKEQVIPVSLDLEGVHISGCLTAYSNKKLVVVSLSDSKEKYQIEAYLRYLLAAAIEQPVDVYLISDGCGEFMPAETLCPESAKKKLVPFLKKYRQGHKSILPFCPGFLVEAEEWEAMDDKKFKELLYKKFNPVYGSGYVDPYIEQEYKDGYFDREGILEQFRQNIRELFLDLEEFQLVNKTN